MHKLSFVLCLALTGCSSYFLAKYDTTEYSIANEINTLAQVSKQSCNNPVIIKKVSKDLYYKSLLLKNFSSGFKYNDDAVKAADSLSKISEGLAGRYEAGEDVSVSYCELKLNAIQDTSVAIQQTIARKPR